MGSDQTKLDIQHFSSFNSEAVPTNSLQIVLTEDLLWRKETLVRPTSLICFLDHLFPQSPSLKILSLLHNYAQRWKTST